MRRILTAAIVGGIALMPLAVTSEAEAAWCVLPGQAGTECTVDGLVTTAHNLTCDSYEAVRGRDSWYWFFC